MGRITYITGEDPLNRGLGTKGLGHWASTAAKRGEKILHSPLWTRIVYFCTHYCETDCYDISTALNVSRWRGERGNLAHSPCTEQAKKTK